MGEQSVAGQLLSLMLLISPFFFWGTSMVSMKVISSEFRLWLPR